MSLAMKHHQYPNFNPVNAIDLAADKIAPSWPLDQSIAVNPWWKIRNMDMTETAAKLGFLGNVRMLMPKDYYKSLWQTELSEEHLNEAKAYFGVKADTETLVDYLDNPDTTKHWVHIGDFLDDQPSHHYRISWREEVLQQISNFCAFYLKFPEHFNYQSTEKDGFYKAWRASAIADKGMQILTGEHHLHALFSSLPDSLEELVIQQFYDLTEVNIDPKAWEDYVYALVLDINGWASWLAYDEWQANLYSKEHSELLRQLIAIRMAWDWVLWQNTLLTDETTFQKLSLMFSNQFNHSKKLQMQFQQENIYLWVWHTASEIKFQQSMHEKLTSTIRLPVKNPVLQAVFCIDVRSEQYRKQLEAQHSEIETYGFAGFFGLPIAYTSKAGTSIRPQLPGLLRPSLYAKQSISITEAKKKQSSLKRKVSWKLAYDSAASTFGVVESQGLLKVFDLLKQTIFGSTQQRVIASKEADYDWHINTETSTLETEELVALAKSILNGIGLKKPYAERVLIVGHGSFSTNNPHASCLDCGACGGQSGEVNAMLLCYVLNRKDIRAALNENSLNIPENTIFVPCLHNTITDEIIVLNNEKGDWVNWLDAATAACQEKRLEADGHYLPDAKTKQSTLNNKSKDWAQLRPEWGLVNNAAFVVAPRAFTRATDFEGRSFLHDYYWQTDHDFQLLEQIMTAPMIVTNWINLQYYASVTDNKHYGSGNKMLHNVVGGNFGVFEGNGGDLRIGLPQQSLHDGKKWRHNPIRLNVYIAAPKEAIHNIIQKHDMIKDLVTNKWLFLFQWDYKTSTIWAYRKNEWKEFKVINQSTTPQSTLKAICKQIELDGWLVETASKKIKVNQCIVETKTYPKKVKTKKKDTHLKGLHTKKFNLNRGKNEIDNNMKVGTLSKIFMDRSHFVSSQRNINQALNQTNDKPKSTHKKIIIDGCIIEVPRKKIVVNDTIVETDDSPVILDN